MKKTYMEAPLNIAYESHALMFAPAHMGVTFDGSGPKHCPAPKGASADYDGNVHFCFYAPEAREMAVVGYENSDFSETVPMVKGADGYWRASVSNVKPGIHLCSYLLDGNYVVNPDQALCHDKHHATNWFEVPDRNDDTYICKDVPHGTLHMELFKSSKTGMMRNCWVYTPASYYENPDRYYPVMYLQHGGSESEACWIWEGKINYIADNLFAEGKAEEMIIVLNCLYDIDYSIAFEDVEKDLTGDFDSVLTKDCMPFIENKYRILKDGNHRAIAGFSMGSYATASAACYHPGLFAYVAMLSGSFDDRWYSYCHCREVLEHDPEMREKTKLFYMSVGTNEFRLHPQVLENIEFLKKCGVRCELAEYPEMYHEITICRKSVRRFMEQLFKD